MKPRELQYGDWVRTADGTVGRVCEAPYRGNVEVETDSGAGVLGKVSLPAGELRRVSDPYRKRPAITGVPDERPRCVYCDRPLVMVTRDTDGDIQGPLGPRRGMIARAFVRWRHYGYDGALFDTLGCAMHFAIAAHKAGYRITRRAK